MSSLHEEAVARLRRTRTIKPDSGPLNPDVRFYIRRQTTQRHHAVVRFHNAVRIKQKQIQNKRKKTDYATVPNKIR